MDYEKMLDEGLKKLKTKVVVATSRFDIPTVKGHVEGKKTILKNFNQIVSALNRDPQHVLKFLLNELATPGKLEDQRLILGRKLSSSFINSKIEEYCNKYVLCYECKKPDTILIEEEGRLFIRCTACGAKHAVKE